MIWNWLRRHPRLVDAGVVLVVGVATAGVASRHPHPVAGGILAALAALVLWQRRRRPLLVVGATAVLSVAVTALTSWLLPLALGVALYTLASTLGAAARRPAAVAVGAVLVALLATSGLGDALFHTLFLVAAWFLGDSIGSRRAYVREIEEKAERLERERETEARRAAAEEQARIARELHDVVAHALSVIVVQAGAADDVFDSDPSRTREAVRAIDASARAALRDLRRVLGVLQIETEYEPQPGLDQLDRLVERVRATGIAVALEVDGAPRVLPAPVELSAYRIVQEALTNTLKHAGARRVDVRVAYGDELRLEIADDGHGQANGGGSGSGLIGMRERVAMLGGTVTAGSAPGGGYRVAASIPLDGAAA